MSRWEEWCHRCIGADDQILRPNIRRIIPASAMMIRLLNLVPDVCNIIVQFTIDWAAYMYQGDVGAIDANVKRQMALSNILVMSYKLAQMNIGYALDAGRLRVGARAEAIVEANLNDAMLAFCRLYACDDEFYAVVCKYASNGIDRDAWTACEYIFESQVLIKYSFWAACCDPRV